MSEVKENTIGKEFSLIELMKFASAPILTQFVSSLLSSLDDGLFISRYCGKDALAAFSICMPWYMLINAFANLFCGIATYCSQLMGEKKHDEANNVFTTSLCFCFVFGLITLTIVRIGMNPILNFLGITERTYQYAADYMGVSCFCQPLMFAYVVSSCFFVPAGQPKLTAITSITQTVLNFLFDYIFMVKMQTGIVGTAYANLISMLVISIISFVFFSGKRAEIRLTKPTTDLKELIQKFWSFGRSQFLTLISISINSYVCNYVIMSIGNEDTLSAYTIVNNIQFIFMSCYFGLSSATSPIASYAYGEKNCHKLARIIKQTFKLTTYLSIIILAAYLLGADFMSGIYLTGNESNEYLTLVKQGMRLTPIVYAFLGYNLVSQDTFNALSNHKIATILTIFENVVFSNLTIIVMPQLYGMNGMWLSFVVSEFLTFVPTVYFAYRYRNYYGYGRNEVCRFE